jgi:hypothetical protein
VHEPELRRFGDPARLFFRVNDAADLQRAQGWTAELEPVEGAPL